LIPIYFRMNEQLRRLEVIKGQIILILHYMMRITEIKINTTIIILTSMSTIVPTILETKNSTYIRNMENARMITTYKSRILEIAFTTQIH